METRTQPQAIIAEIEATSSRLEKEAILSRAVNENIPEFFEGLKYCYDQMITFGVKEVPESTVSNGQGLPWAAFVELAESLRYRKLTGHDARDAIALAMSVATAEQWNGWYRRILIKDMRAGFSETTVNKVVKKLKRPEYTIPVFSCQLAEPADSHSNLMKGTVICDPKYDGTRAIVFLNYLNHTVTIYSRNGKVFKNFGHIEEGLEPLIDVFGRDTILDGEIISSSFQELMKQVHRKTDVNATDAKLIVFDCLPAVEFQAGKSVMRQKTRLNFLKGFKNAISDTGVAEVVDSKEFNLDDPASKAEFNKWAESVVEAGLEGVMVKNPDAIYECKRTTAWLKIKPSITIDLEVVEVEEGTGRNKGRAGALVCEGADNGRKIRVNVGSGLSDQDREEIWKNQKLVIGSIAEVEADAVTKSQDESSEWSLRFPRFKTWRSFGNTGKI